MNEIITKGKLKSLGYVFDNEIYESSFIDFLNRKLIKNIGVSVSNMLTEEQMKAVSDLIGYNTETSIDEVVSMLDKLLPGYEKIVQKEIDLFILEIKTNKKSVLKQYELNKRNFAVSVENRS